MGANLLTFTLLFLFTGPLSALPACRSSVHVVNIEAGSRFGSAWRAIVNTLLFLGSAFAVIHISMFPVSLVDSRFPRKPPVRFVGMDLITATLVASATILLQRRYR